MSGGGQTSTTTSSSGPPAYLQPYLTYGAGQAQNLYNSSAPSYYPGTTVARQSPYTTAANQGIAARAINGSPVVGSASSYLQNVLGGKYLGSNPYLGAVDQSVRDAVIPSVESQWSAGGRYGSPNMGSELARQIADAIAPYHYGDYQNERANQQAAMGAAPSLANQDWIDLQNVANAGQGIDAYNQRLVNAPVNQWNYNQNLAYNKLAQYMGLLLGGGFGSQGTATQTQPGTSPLNALLGLGGGFLGAIL
jgi:hypothetical protein